MQENTKYATRLGHCVKKPQLLSETHLSFSDRETYDLFCFQEKRSVQLVILWTDESKGSKAWINLTTFHGMNSVYTITELLSVSFGCLFDNCRDCLK